MPAYKQHKWIHPVFGISWWCVGVLSGALLARFIPTYYVNEFWVYVICLVWVAILCRVGRAWCVILLILIGLVVGHVRGSSYMVQAWPISQFINQQVNVTGNITEDVGIAKNGSGAVRLWVDSVNSQPAAGQIWVSVSADRAKMLKRSDRVELKGKMQAGFGSFSGSMYRAQVVNIKREVGKDLMLDMRDWLSEGISRHIPEREAALGAGYILGQKHALPADFDDSLRIVGLTHVVVASGYNLTILVRLARRLFAKISRYVAMLAAGGLTLAFVGITGASPSMTRAGMVAGLSLVAWYYGRNLHPIVLLLITAAGSVLIQPSYIWGDVGWMLSFAAFSGVMLFAPVVQAYFYGNKKPGILRQILGETLSAQLFTLPIILVMFGTLSNVALLANLLVLPLVPLAMLLVFISAITTIWLPIFAPFTAAVATLLLQYMTKVVDVLSGLSWASVEIEFSWQMAVVAYVVIITLTIWLWRKTKFSYAGVNLIE